jgi:hypothetical protein
MNSELQAQTDVLVKAITHLETTLHQDLIVAISFLGGLLIVLCVLTVFRRR